jgi:hypothetical protein
MVDSLTFVQAGFSSSVFKNGMFGESKIKFFAVLS